MRRKIRCIVIILIFFILFLKFLYPEEQSYYVREVISPLNVVLDNGRNFKINGYETFGPVFCKRNAELAKHFNLTEEEAFVIGKLGKYWAKNLLENRKVNIDNNNITFRRNSYITKFENTPYCIKDGKFCNEAAAEKLIKTVKHTGYALLDVETEKIYPISKTHEGLLVIRQGYRKNKHKEIKADFHKNEQILNPQNVKLILTDFTKKLKPDRNCSSDICKEILFNINNSKTSIDMAIYGYSSVLQIEDAIQKAIKRGVKIRMVYDCDANNKNIYEDTFYLADMIKNSRCDFDSANARFIMHNKFFIFDNKTVITGSSNLSYTDMSGFNSNALLVINSSQAAKIYQQEFEQMYNGKFHNEKSYTKNDGEIYFSPQNKTITNGILPLIRNAQNYIYIPAFIIIEKQTIEELIQAKKRGVDVKIIADALNASAKYSKIKEIRASGIPVKIENYAGKLHSKTMIIDDRYLVVGSMNFSYSGENRNDENTLILDNSKAAIFYRKFFEALWDKIPSRWLNDFPRAESIDSIGSCSDGQDNDYDGLIDSADEGCRQL